jgi:hypothetical protein
MQKKLTILMVIYIKTIVEIIIIILLFIFDIDSIDSNSDKILIYDRVNIHDENDFTIFFKNSINSYDLDDILEEYNITINSYIIDDKKYYARDIINLINEYTSNKNLEEKIYFKIHGIIIDGLNVTCENEEVKKLSNIEKIY